MHVLIINGSPRVKKYSNTDKILEKFIKGMCENGTTFEQYEVSDKAQWDDMREAFNRNKNILIALPLYVECIPGLLMEFLETLTPKNDGSQIAFILQSGFAEGIQLRCAEAYLEKLNQSFEKILENHKKFDELVNEDGTSPYDSMLNQRLDTMVGKGTDTISQRNCMGAIEQIRGQQKAIENGWGMNELAVVGSVFSQVYEIEKKLRYGSVIDEMTFPNFVNFAPGIQVMKIEIRQRTV